MKSLLHHDVPVEIARVLAQAGNQVQKVMGVLRPTASDPKVFDYALQHELVLITCNRDDSLNLAAERRHAGPIILIRRRTRIAECAALIRLLDRAGHAGIDGNINFA